METLRVGVVGVGHLGQHRARLLASMPGVTLAGVADIKPGRAEEIASKYGAQAFLDAREPVPNAKANLLKIIGAKYISAETQSLESMAREIGNVDLVYEATGASRLAFDMIEQLGTNGIFIFTGVPGRKAPIEVDTDLVMRNLVLKNQVVFGTVNAGRDAFEGSIRDLGVFAKRWPEAVKALITGRFSMENHRELLTGRPSGIKNVIRLN